MEVQVFRCATQEDAVRIMVQDGDGISTLPYMFPTPAWEGVEASYHPADFAMCEALCFMGASWGGGYDIPIHQVGARLSDTSN